MNKHIHRWLYSRWNSKPVIRNHTWHTTTSVFLFSFLRRDVSGFFQLLSFLLIHLSAVCVCIITYQKRRHFNWQCHSYLFGNQCNLFFNFLLYIHTHTLCIFICIIFQLRFRFININHSLCNYLKLGGSFYTVWRCDITMALDKEENIVYSIQIEKK